MKKIFLSILCSMLVLFGLYAEEYTFTATEFTANGTKTLNGVDWTLAGDGGYWGYDGTTDIEYVNSKSEEPDAIFDLAGRRIKCIEAPGIYIVGGKKVLVK